MVATVAAGTTADYYLNLTTYYTGGHEPQGRWLRVGFEAGFEPGSPVMPAEFHRLHAALDRHDRPMLANTGGKLERTSGYDITFSAPKSVSIFGLSSTRRRGPGSSRRRREPSPTPWRCWSGTPPSPGRGRAGSFATRHG